MVTAKAVPNVIPPRTVSLTFPELGIALRIKLKLNSKSNTISGFLEVWLPGELDPTSVAAGNLGA